ncbi:MAG: SusD/RagB family nutrient-binding outer membrane lipoprotein, partial [Verrucomicrobia bacterium]|nr:SusD/RagB family nutrient-binding outer membrane lipoprotein [Cytophagales bacterium]
EERKYTFDFDPQDEVYAEVVRLSNESLDFLNRSNNATGVNAFSRGDLVYRGDVKKWKKFMFAVLARNAHHLTNKPTYSPDRVIALVDSSFTSNADNFNVPHIGTSSTDANFFGPKRDNMGGFRQTVFALSLLNGTVFSGVKDPRLPLMYTASPDSVFRGIVAGLSDPNSSTNNIRRIPTLWGVQPELTAIGIARNFTGKYVYTDNANHPMVTYAELQFIKSEAAFKKGDLSLALDAYTKGIAAHLDFARVSATDKTAYLASDAVKKSGATLTIKDIMLQKYIALIGHGCLESWVDMRRYKYDTAIYQNFTLPSPLYVDNGGKLAQRVRPRFNSEYVWNRSSLDKIGGNNPDYHTKEMWFSQP